MPPQPPADPVPAIGYIRVSWLQEEQISPDIQRAAIADWARRKGRRIVRWIEDLDVSGRTFHRKIMEGIEAVEAGEAKEIAVWKFSRFGRNRAGCAVNLGRINRVGGDLISATEEVDARTAVGKLTRGMLMELAAFESDRAGEQWAETHANRRARGLPPHGRPRFGYVRRGRVRDPLQPNRTIRDTADGEERYEVDPVTGPVLADAYRRYLAGEGARKITLWLNEGGWLGPRGRTWSVVQLLRVLDSGFGAGLLRTHDPDCGCGKQPKDCRNVLYLPGAHEPVITPQEWDAYRNHRAHSARMPPRARVSPYPLTGRIWCGHCGKAMTIAMHHGTPGHRYICNGYLRHGVCAARSVLRSAVEDAVIQSLTSWADTIEAAPEATSLRPAEAAPDPAPLKAEIERLNRALDRLTRQLALELVPEDSYRRTRDELLADRAAAEERLAVASEPSTPQPRDWVPVMRALAEEWPTLPVDARREMVAKVVESVQVFRTDQSTAWVEITPVWGGEVHKAKLVRRRRGATVTVATR